MTAQRRAGDIRPVKRDPDQALTLKVSHPFRWLPGHGDPFCVAEWASQKFIKLIAFAPVYTAIVVTLMYLTR